MNAEELLAQATNKINSSLILARYKRTLIDYYLNLDWQGYDSDYQEQYLYWIIDTQESEEGEVVAFAESLHTQHSLVGMQIASA